MTTTLDLPDRVDPDAVLGAAQQAAATIDLGVDAVEVQLEPGDSTCYRLVLARPTGCPLAAASKAPCRWVQPGDLLVTLLTPNVGANTWGPHGSGWTSPDYVAEKWSCSEWTARVVAAFLNALRDELTEVAS